MSKELTPTQSLPTPPPSTFIPLPNNNLEPLIQLELPPPLSTTSSNNYLPSRANYYHSSIPSSSSSNTKHSNYDSRGSMNSLLNPMPTEIYETNSNNLRLSRATPTTLTNNKNDRVEEESWPTRGYFSADKDPLFNHPVRLFHLFEKRLKLTPSLVSGNATFSEYAKYKFISFTYSTRSNNKFIEF